MMDLLRDLLILVAALLGIGCAIAAYVAVLFACYCRETGTGQGAGTRHDAVRL